MDESMVRISCGSMCRIQIDGQYLLILNHNRRQKSAYQLSPIGGAIEIDDWSYLDDFDYTPENPDSLDLRLKLRASQVDQFRQWFYLRRNREMNPFREIYEELVDEAGILYELRRQDMSIRFVQFVEDTKQTIRKGLTGEWTRYFFEIHEVTFLASDVLLQLKSSPPSKGVVLVEEHIAKIGAPITMHIDGAERQVELVTEYLFADHHDNI